HPPIRSGDDLVDHELVPIPHLEPLGEEAPNALDTVIRGLWPVAEVARVPHDLFVVDGEERGEVATEPGIPRLPDDLYVLPRHRARSIPQHLCGHWPQVIRRSLRSRLGP